MKNKLEYTLDHMTAEEKERLYGMIDTEILADEQTMVRVEAQIKQKLPKKRTFLAKAWKPAAIAAAACAVIYISLGLTVPGVADGLYHISHPETSSERYFSQEPDEREPITEIEQAIENTKFQDVDSSVELIGSYSGALFSDAEYNRSIEASGERPAIDPNDYAYLLTLKPELSEVYYDGTRLIVTAYFDCPYAGDFLSGFGNRNVSHTHNLDMRTFEAVCTVNGTQYSFGSYGHGVIPSYEKEENGFFMQTDFDLSSPLPDGTAELTLYYYIYNEDTIKTTGGYNVARVIHTFTFRTESGNRQNAKTLSLALSGSAPVTVWTLNQNTMEYDSIQNRTVSFDGVSLTVTVSYLPRGVTVSWKKDDFIGLNDEDLINSLFGNRTEGLQFDVYVNGEKIERFIPYGTGKEQGCEIPVFDGDWDGIETITLVPKIVRMTEYCTNTDLGEDVTTGESILLPIDGTAHPYPDDGLTATGWEETILFDSAIELPKP